MPADPASTIKLAISATRRNSQRVQALLGSIAIVDATLGGQALVELIGDGCESDSATPPAVLPLYYDAGMVVRKKRSISMPPELDSSIESAAAAEGTSYSGWLAAVVRKEFTLRAGLDAVAGFERSHGRFTPDEIAEAETWAKEALARSTSTGTRRRRRPA